MKTGKVFSVVVIVVVTAVALFVVHPSRVARADDSATQVVIDMDDFHFTIEGQTAGAPITLKAGTLYDLTVKNTGKYPHEIWFGKDPQMGEDVGRLDGYKTNLLANVPVAIKGGEPDTPTGYEIDVTGLVEIEEGLGQAN